MKLDDVKSSTYIGFDKENNKESSKFKVSNLVKIPKHKNIFAKFFVLNWTEKVFVVKKLKTLCRGHMTIVILRKETLL